MSVAERFGTLETRKANENDYYPAFAEAGGNGHDKERGGGDAAISEP